VWSHSSISSCHSSTICNNTIHVPFANNIYSIMYSVICIPFWTNIISVLLYRLLFTYSIQLFNGCGCNTLEYLPWGPGNDQRFYCTRPSMNYCTEQYSARGVYSTDPSWPLNPFLIGFQFCRLVNQIIRCLIDSELVVCGINNDGCTWSGQVSGCQCVRMLCLLKAKEMYAE
jgi:hypothetical protein